MLFNSVEFLSVPTPKIISCDLYLHIYRVPVAHCCFLRQACGSYSHCATTALVQRLGRWNFAFSRVPPAETIPPSAPLLQGPKSRNAKLLQSNQSLHSHFTFFGQLQIPIPPFSLRTNQGPTLNRKRRVILLATRISVSTQTRRSAATAPNAL